MANQTGCLGSPVFLFDVDCIVAGRTAEGGEVRLGLEVGVTAAAGFDAGVVFPGVPLDGAAAVLRQGIVVAGATVGDRQRGLRRNIIRETEHVI